MINPWQPGTIMLSVATKKRGTENVSAVLANYVLPQKEVVTVAQDVGYVWPTVGRVMDECPRIGKIKQLLIYTNDEDFLKVYTPPIKLKLDHPDQYWHWFIGRRLFMVPRWRLTRMEFAKMENTVRLFQ